eukprot:3276862-Rhodomonas_salina.1
MEQYVEGLKAELQVRRFPQPGTLFPQPGTPFSRSGISTGVLPEHRHEHAHAQLHKHTAQQAHSSTHPRLCAVIDIITDAGPPSQLNKQALHELITQKRVAEAGRVKAWVVAAQTALQNMADEGGEEGGGEGDAAQEAAAAAGAAGAGAAGAGAGAGAGGVQQQQRG